MTISTAKTDDSNGEKINIEKMMMKRRILLKGYPIENWTTPQHILIIPARFKV